MTTKTYEEFMSEINSENIAEALKNAKKCLEAFTPEDIIRQQQETINRQKAEIEQLKIENRILSQKRISFPERLEIDRKARAEAVKEFAERFENELTKIEEIYFDEEHENFISANKVIALLVNLVKEMEGES